MSLPNTIGLMFIYVHCQPCDPRGLAKLCTDCTEKIRSSRGGKTAYGSIAPFCIRWSSVVTKLLLRVCKKEGSCRTSVKLLVGLHLSVGLWLAVSFITQGLLRIPYQWLEPWVGLLKETHKKYIFRHYSKTNSCLNIVTLKLKHGFDNFLYYISRKWVIFRGNKGHWSQSRAHLHMTGIPVHILTNWGSRRADDRCLPQPIVLCNLPREAGQAWARLTGREGEGIEYSGGKQPSLQQEEEGGKEKERAKAHKRVKIRE